MSGKYFGITFCQVSHNSPGSRSPEVFSWGAHPDQESTPRLYSLGSSKLGVTATTSVSLPTLSPVTRQTSGLWFLCINNSGKAQIPEKM